MNIHSIHEYNGKGKNKDLGTLLPTRIPTANPTTQPEKIRTSAPVVTPSLTPSSTPTTANTATATFIPTASSTSTATHIPTVTATNSPTLTPTKTATPTATPTVTLTPTVTPTPTPLTPLLTLSPQSPGTFTITGGNSPSTSTVFILLNSGNGSSETLLSPVLTGANSTNFKIHSDTCAGSSLAPTDTCTFSVQLVASDNGTFSSTVSIGDGEVSSDSVLLTGTASGYVTTLVLTPGSSIGMDLTSGVSPGTAVTFTVQNSGNLASASLQTSQLSGTDTDKYSIVSDSCTGNVLAPSQSCTFGVEPVTTVNGSFTAQLVIGDGSVSSNTTTLSGSATGFCDPKTSLSATGFYSNDFNDDISGWSDWGNAISMIDATTSDSGGQGSSYWTPDLGNGDRALSFLKPFSYTLLGWERTFTNTTGSVITAISLQYDIEISWSEQPAGNARNFDLRWGCIPTAVIARPLILMF